VAIYDSQLLKGFTTDDYEFQNLIFKCAGFWCGQLRERNHMEGVDGKTILQWI